MTAILDGEQSDALLILQCMLQEFPIGQQHYAHAFLQHLLAMAVDGAVNTPV